MLSIKINGAYFKTKKQFLSSCLTVNLERERENYLFSLAMSTYMQYILPHIRLSSPTCQVYNSVKKQCNTVYNTVKLILCIVRTKLQRKGVGQK